jgi:hypothetical protein
VDAINIRTFCHLRNFIIEYRGALSYRHLKYDLIKVKILIKSLMYRLLRISIQDEDIKIIQMHKHASSEKINIDIKICRSKIMTV